MDHVRRVCVGTQFYGLPEQLARRHLKQLAQSASIASLHSAGSDQLLQLQLPSMDLELERCPQSSVPSDCESDVAVSG